MATPTYREQWEASRERGRGMFGPRAGGLSEFEETSPLSLKPVGEEVERRRREMESAPQYSSFDADTQTVTLGKPEPFDIYKIFSGEGYSRSYGVDEIARTLVEDVHNLPAEAYDLLKQSMTDEEIMVRLASDPVTGSLFSMPTDRQAFTSGLQKGTAGSATIMAPAIAGGLIAGPPGALGGGALGLIASIFTNSTLFPKERISPARRGQEMTGEFVGYSLPTVALPWLSAPNFLQGSVSQYVPQFVKKMVNKLPWIAKGPIKAPGALAKLVDVGLEQGRRYPGTFITGEAGAIAGGAIAGEMLSDETAVDPTWGRVGSEFVGSIINPVNMGLLTMVGARNLITQSYANLSATGRRRSIGDQLVKILDAAADEGGTLDAAALEQLLGDDSPYVKLLKQYGIDPGNPTSAEKTGHPVLSNLQAAMAKADPNGFGARLNNSARTNLVQMERLMAGLLELNTPEALGLYAQMRDRYFKTNMEGFVARQVQRFEEQMDILTRGGEEVDADAMLERLLRETLEAARVQETALYNRIPTNFPSDAKNLLDTYARLQQQHQVGSQAFRLSAGDDVISLDIAMSDLRRILAGEGELAAADATAGKEVSKLLADAEAETPKKIGDARLPLPEQVTSGMLLNLRRVFSEAINRESMQSGPAGQTQLGEILTELEAAARRDIANLTNPQWRRAEIPGVDRDISGGRITGEMPEGAVAGGGTPEQAIDDAINFSDSVNDTFMQTLVGSVRASNKSPELLMMELMTQKPAGLTLAMQQLDDAARFLVNRLEEGFIPGQGVPTRTPEGVFVVPEGADTATIALYDELNEIYPRLTDLRTMEDRVLRGIFEKFRIRDPRTNEVVPDIAGINNYLNKPSIRKALQDYFPDMLRDLENVQTAGQLFHSVNQRATQRMESARNQIPLFQFMTDTALPVKDNPAAVISEMLGYPGATRPENPIQNLTAVAKNIANVSDENMERLNRGRAAGNLREFTREDLKEGLFEAITSQAWIIGRGENPEAPFSFTLVKQYMEDPIVPRGADPQTGQKSGDSILDILRREGIIEDSQWKDVGEVLEQGAKIQEAMIKGDTSALAALYGETPITVDLVTRIIGAKGGTTLAGMLPGSMGSSSLIAASAGSAALRNLLDKVPGSMFKDLWMEALTDPALLRELLQEGVARKGKGLETTGILGLGMDWVDLPVWGKAYSSLRTALLSMGLKELPSFEESIMEATGTRSRGAPGAGTGSTGRELTPGELAGARRQELRRRGPEVVEAQETIITPAASMTETAEEILPQGPPQGPPRPPPRPPPVAAGPPSGDRDRNRDRQRLAAAYPFDITSDVIRTQGIGSLV